VLLLVVQHLALLDQQQHSPHTSGSSRANAVLPASCSSSSSISSLAAAAAVAAAGQKVQLKIDTTAGPGSSSESGWLQQMLSDLGARDEMVSTTSSSSSSSTAGTTDAWLQLQQLPDAAFADKLRSSQLPRVLPGRVLAQLSLVASMGRDPVNSLEGLHVAAAQAELLQLLQQQACAAAAAPQGTLAAAAAAGVGGRAGLMLTAEISSALRLLPCSSFVAAAHKLMLWLQSCTDQHSRCMSGSEAAGAPAAAASVAVVSGSWQPGVQALAATAAAALGATVVRLQLLQPGHAEQERAAAVQAAAAAAVPEAADDAVDCEQALELACDDTTEQQLGNLSEHEPAAAAAAGPAMVVALVDLQQHGDSGLSGEQLQELLLLLRRWSSQAPGCVAPSAPLHTQQQLQEDGLLSVGAPCVSFIVLCAPHTAQQLLQDLSALQSHCCQLALPAGEVAEQLAADCKAQLMSSCGWALLEHVRDAHCLAQQQQQQGLICSSSDSSKDNDEVPAQAGSAKQLVVSTSGAAALAAAPAEPAARHLAERLAAALASIHQAVYEAYEERYSRISSSSSSVAGNAASAASTKAYRVQPSNAQHVAALETSQAVPLARPFDVLQLLPGLLSEGRSRLVARRASLATCLAKTAKVQQQVQDLLQRRRQQLGTAAAAAAGTRVDAVAAEVEVLSRLAEQLQLRMSKWSAELEQQVGLLQQDFCMSAAACLLCSMLVSYAPGHALPRGCCFRITTAL
jgi:hypothetical protein